MLEAGGLGAGGVWEAQVYPVGPVAHVYRARVVQSMLLFPVSSGAAGGRPYSDHSAGRLMPRRSRAWDGVVPSEDAAGVPS